MNLCRWYRGLFVAVSLTLSVPAVAEVKPSARIDYAEQLLMQSESAKRVQKEGSEQAKALFNEALALYQQARDIQNAGGDIKQAERLGGDALRKFTAAVKLLPKLRSVDEELHARYTELLEELRTYMTWYDNSPYVTRDEQQTVDRVKAGMAEASQLVSVRRIAEANRLLTEMLQNMVELSNRSLKSDTIISTLDFDTPLEEYQYELARNIDYKRLIPIAIEQKDPTASRLMLMKRFEAQADKLRAQADEEFSADNLTQAIKSLQASTDQLIRSLGVIGVR